ncbi:MAG TPA: tripartite tricarboxylate transporter substrate binding protein [Candidatus Obscuribacterales bacterium]
MNARKAVTAMFLGSLMAGISALDAVAQARFPTKPIQIVVTFSAGSQTDILARMIGKKMSENWGQPVIVVNRLGGGGIAAGSTVARATPNGHTLLAHSAGFAVAPTLYSTLPYDTLNDFAAVSQIASVPFVVVAAPSLGLRSVAELIALAKRKPGQVNFGSAGIGSATHLGAEQFRLVANIDVVHVPYKGTPEALIDTVAGRVQYFVSPIEPALPLIRDGKLLPLAVTTMRRLPVLPDVPTVAEAGLANFEFNGWVGLWAPAKTPKAVLNQLSNEVKRILSLPDVKEHMQKQGLVPKSSTPEEFAAFTRAEIEKLGKIVKASGARAD